jgi:uncharacterized protein YggL (DUF469 family)
MSASCPEYGFELQLRMEPGIPAGRSDAIVTAFVEHLEGLGLSAGGGGGDHEWHFIITRVGSQAIDGDRGAVEAWARARAGIQDVIVGPLLDVSE